MQKFLLFLILIVICNFANAEITQDLAIMLKSYPKMTLSKLEITQRKAEMGNTEAQFELGMLYQNTSQYTFANQWFEQASNNGMGNATDFLAQNYLLGQGVSQDSQKALQLLNKAVQQGYLLSNQLLGNLYQRGKFVPKNEEIAVSKFLTIADYDLNSAKALQGIFCQNSSKLFDKKQCEKWAITTQKIGSETSSDDDLIREAYTGGHIAQYELAIYYHPSYEDSIPKIEKNANKAFFWMSKSALQNYDEAQLMLGIMYLKGIGVPKDDKKAFEFITLASKQENENAQYLLGLMYATGTGIEEDYQQAIYWYQKSVGWQNIRAYPALGFAYWLGKGVKRDTAMAKYWFKKACDNGNQTGCDNYQQLIKQDN